MPKTTCPHCHHPAHPPGKCSGFDAEGFGTVACGCDAGASTETPELKPTTVPYRDGLLERLKDAEYAREYLRAAIDDYLPVFIAAVQDVAESWNRRTEPIPAPAPELEWGVRYPNGWERPKDSLTAAGDFARAYNGIIIVRRAAGKAGPWHVPSKEEMGNA